MATGSPLTNKGARIVRKAARRFKPGGQKQGWKTGANQQEKCATRHKPRF